MAVASYVVYFKAPIQAMTDFYGADRDSIRPA
jgi:hypothetical protein